MTTTKNQSSTKILGEKLNTTTAKNSKKGAQRAFTFFCTPTAGGPKKKMEKFLSPAKETVLQVENCDIQTYHWEGTGKKLLLIHGWETNSYRWSLQLPDLQEAGYDIYAIDAPAHGFSTGRILNSPLYARIIEAAYQEIKPDLILAHSLGALSTIYHQYLYPESKVDALALLGTASSLHQLMTEYRDALELNEETFDAMEGYVADTFGFKPEEFYGAKFAKEFTTPALLIHDTSDKVAEIEASRALNKVWEGSKYIETSGYSHDLFREEVTQHVVDFLANHS